MMPLYQPSFCGPRSVFPCPLPHPKQLDVEIQEMSSNIGKEQKIEDSKVASTTL